MSHPQADAFRRRAAQLRSLATAIESTPALRLDRHAGVETWFGPRPDACRRALSLAVIATREAATDLRVTASGFVRHADALEANQL